MTAPRPPVESHECVTPIEEQLLIHGLTAVAVCSSIQNEFLEVELEIFMCVHNRTHPYSRYMYS